MAENYAKASQYEYKLNSNLVLRADRKELPKETSTGEPETLYGRVDPKEFGSKALRAAPEEELKKARKLKEESEKSSFSALTGGKSISTKVGAAKRFLSSLTNADSILGSTEVFEGLRYRPKTKESKQTYEMILSFVQNFLDDQPRDVIRGAADEAIEIIKNDNLKDFDRKKELENVLGSISTDQFNQLINLTRLLADYSSADAAAAADEEANNDIDEVGLAVVFDDDENDQEGGDGAEGGAETFEVKDEEEEEEDEEAGADNISSVPPVVSASLATESTENIILGKGARSEVSEQATGFEKHVSKYYVSVHDIDAYWLQRQISAYFDDALVSQEMTGKVFSVLVNSEDDRECENELVLLLEFDKFELVKLLTKNRLAIVFCTRFNKAASDEERNAIINEYSSIPEASEIINRLGISREEESKLYEGPASSAANGKRNVRRKRTEGASTAMEIDDDVPTKSALELSVPKLIDLNTLTFAQGSHLMTNKKCRLPENSYKKTKKGYEEIYIPAPESKPFGAKERLIPISELPSFTHAAFKGVTNSLNRVQSKLCKTALESDQNLLLCAPTGAGKTNVALLTILRELGKHMDPESKKIDVDSFKIIYIAPMKALVAEMVNSFSKRLAPYGIKVSELTGDRQLTKSQIAETQIIVTTPEKWDVITRKSTDRSYTNLVRLIIIDEVHLLHDERGPVIESIVSRTIRAMEETHDFYVRLVGLSATLPNYEDVARFMRVDLKTGLFFFDNTYRPVPLQQQFVGITEKKALKRVQLLNELTYEKVMERAGKNQMLIFVHSRRDTAKTARFVRDLAIERDTIGAFVRDDNQASREILQNQAESSGTKNVDLKDLLPYGFAIHHAGMTRADRTMVEELFAEGHIQVLVSTATLAWGVNLPAHTVIIKGTQIYNPEKGRWMELTPQDMLQMLGRAGRPQYDSVGEGIILTTHQELQYYLSLLNQQLPIESQFVSRLIDNMNAEIVLGTIRNRDEAVLWLSYTYLYVRMLQDPQVYGITSEEIKSDPSLKKRRLDLVHSAANALEKCSLLKYERKSGQFQVTEAGRIASYYYINHASMMSYNNHLKPHMGEIELFRVFSMSNEFRHMLVREEEKLELSKLMERLPIPIKESIEDSSSLSGKSTSLVGNASMAKVNVLLQSYISQLKLEGFALGADMVYVTQSALRILRAMFELCLRRGWARLAKKALDLCKMVDRRSWNSMSPLRQFSVSSGLALSPDLLRKLERKDFPFIRYFDLNAQELGELVRIPRMGKVLHNLLELFPRVDIQAQVQPITRSVLKIDLSLTPTFTFDPKVHGAGESFWVIVEDADGEVILYADQLIVKEKYAGEEHLMSFTVTLFDPLPPNYFVSVISDRWLHSETKLPISFSHLILPEKYAPPSELLDLQPLSIAALKDESFESVLCEKEGISHFNGIQSQTFSTLYASDENTFIAAPSGSGKTLCAELAMMRLWKRKKRSNSSSLIVYITPYEDLADTTLERLKFKYGGGDFGKRIAKLTGDLTGDLKALERNDLIIGTPAKWDAISRRWKQRKIVTQVDLFIADELHLVGSDVGPTYEVIVSRMRYISMQQEESSDSSKRVMRILGLSACVANGKDLAEWIGAIPGNSIFNFHPNARSVPLEIHLQSFNIPHFASLMLNMGKPAFNAVKASLEEGSSNNTIVFVPSRKQTRLTAAELASFASYDDEVEAGDEEIKGFMRYLGRKASFPAVDDSNLAALLEFGVAYFHEALSVRDKRVIKQLFVEGHIPVLVASKDTCWSLDLVSCHQVIVMGCQYYEGREHRYVDYPMPVILQMMGRAIGQREQEEEEAAKCLVMCHASKKDFYKKFLNEPLPVESHLDHFLPDHFNAEIVARTIENKQDAVDFLTWTFLYRRLPLNPNYYGLLQGTSPRHLSDHLSELVEGTINDLVKSKCISLADDEYEVSPLNLGMISAYYGINYSTMDMFSMSLSESTKLRGLLEIICEASEFESSIPIRHHGEESVVLGRLLERMPVKPLLLATTTTGSKKKNVSLTITPALKTNILLQAHFSRSSLPPDLESDQRLVLSQILPLLQACVDVISSNGWLGPALCCMELSQMIVQGMWDRDSPLKQLPFFTSSVIQIAQGEPFKLGGAVFDLMEMEDEVRDQLFQVAKLGPLQVKEIAKAVNRYPNIEVSYSVEDYEDKEGDEDKEKVYTFAANEVITIKVKLDRELEEEGDDEEGDGPASVSPVIAPYFPKVKDESWWIVIGDAEEKTLLSIKRITLAKSARVSLDFSLSNLGNRTLKLYAMCDSYLGCDQEYDLAFNITPGEEDDEEEDDEEIDEEIDEQGDTIMKD